MTITRGIYVNRENTDLVADVHTCGGDTVYFTCHYAGMRNARQLSRDDFLAQYARPWNV